MVGHLERVIPGDRGDDALHRLLGVGPELHIVDATAFDAHEVVMVVLQRFGELVAGHPVTPMVRRCHSGVREHRERPVYGGEGDGSVEVLHDLGGRHWAAALGEGPDDVPPSRGEADVGAPEAIRDLLGELRDGSFPSTFVAAY